MLEVVDFFFVILRQMWDVITDSWILSIGVLISCIGIVIDLIKAGEED